MEFLLIGASLLTSITFSLILQRANKSSLQLSRLKKSIDLHEHQIQEITIEQTQKIKDAFLDYEMLLGQGQQLYKQLNQQIEGHTQTIEELNHKKNLTEKLSLHIDEMMQATEKVKDRMGVLDAGIQKLDQTEKKIYLLQNNLGKLQNELALKHEQSNLQLNEITESLIKQGEENAQKISDVTRFTFTQIKEEQKDFQQTLDTYKTKIEALNQILENLPQRLEENLEGELSKLGERSQNQEKKILERYEYLEKHLEGLGTKSIAQLQKEIESIYQEIKDKGEDEILKKDIFMKEMNALLEEIKNQAELFQDQYVDAENKFVSDTEQAQTLLQNKIEGLIENWTEQIEEQQHYSETVIKELKEKIIELEQTKFESIEKNTRDYKKEIEVIVNEGKQEIESLVEGSKNEIKDNLNENVNHIVLSLQDSRKELDDLVTQLKKELAEIGVNNIEELQQNENEVRQNLQILIDEAQKVSMGLSQNFEDIARANTICLEENLSLTKNELKNFKEGLLSSLKEKHALLEKRSHELLAEQANVYNELKQITSLAEQNLKEELRKSLDIDASISNFETITSAKLSHLNEQAEISIMDFTDKAKEYYNQIKALKETTLQDFQEHKEEARSTHQSILEQVGLLQKKQNSVQENLESISTQLIEEVNHIVQSQQNEFEKNAKNYLSQQEDLFEKVQILTKDIEKDLKHEYPKKLKKEIQEELELTLIKIQEGIQEELFKDKDTLVSLIENESKDAIQNLQTQRQSVESKIKENLQVIEEQFEKKARALIQTSETSLSDLRKEVDSNYKLNIEEKNKAFQELRDYSQDLLNHAMNKLKYLEAETENFEILHSQAKDKKEKIVHEFIQELERHTKDIKGLAIIDLQKKTQELKQEWEQSFIQTQKQKEQLFKEIDNYCRAVMNDAQLKMGEIHNDLQSLLSHSEFQKNHLFQNFHDYATTITSEAQGKLNLILEDVQDSFEKKNKEKQALIKEIEESYNSMLIHAESKVDLYFDEIRSELQDGGAKKEKLLQELKEFQNELLESTKRKFEELNKEVQNNFSDATKQQELFNKEIVLVKNKVIEESQIELDDMQKHFLHSFDTWKKQKEILFQELDSYSKLLVKECHLQMEGVKKEIKEFITMGQAHKESVIDELQNFSNTLGKQTKDKLEAYKTELIQTFEKISDDKGGLFHELNAYCRDLSKKALEEVNQNWNQTKKEMESSFSRALENNETGIEKSLEKTKAIQKQRLAELDEYSITLIQDSQERLLELKGEWDEIFKKGQSHKKDLETTIEEIQNKKTNYNKEADKKFAELNNLSQKLLEDVEIKIANKYESFEVHFENWNTQKNVLIKDFETLALKLKQELSNESRYIKENIDASVKARIHFEEGMEESLSDYSQTLTDKQNDVMRTLSHFLEKEMKEKVDPLKEDLFNILSQIDNRKKEVLKELEKYNVKIEALSQNVDNIIGRAEENLEESINEKLNSLKKIEKLESNLKTDTIEKYVLQLDETLEILNQKIQLAKEENNRVEVYVEQLEIFKLEKENIFQEIEQIVKQKELLSTAERQLHFLESKFPVFENINSMIASLESKIQNLQYFKTQFDGYFNELEFNKEYLRETVGKIEHSQTLTQDILNKVEVAKRNTEEGEKKTQKLFDKIENTEKIQVHLNDRLQQFEIRADSIKDKHEKVDTKVATIEGRFEQMDGLLLDLEKKQKQITNMNERLEHIQDSSVKTVDELSSILSEADEKMDKLSVFYQMIDNLIEEKLQKSLYPTNLLEKNDTTSLFNKKKKTVKTLLPDHKRDGIMSLYLNHKWEAEEIALRLKIDIAMVKAVIHNHIELSSSTPKS